uniref:Uncharacterized protein n=1 Tax=Populus alba TaxID=43335 RepID=A0A4U5QSD1_POPAL|nr:hypothetical protein D5086_0000068460 [Populus alba]
MLVTTHSGVWRSTVWAKDTEAASTFDRSRLCLRSSAGCWIFGRRSCGWSVVVAADLWTALLGFAVVVAAAVGGWTERRGRGRWRCKRRDGTAKGNCSGFCPACCLLEEASPCPAMRAGKKEWPKEGSVRRVAGKENGAASLGERERSIGVVGGAGLGKKRK